MCCLGPGQSAACNVKVSAQVAFPAESGPRSIEHGISGEVIMMQVYRSYRPRAGGRSRGVEMTDPNAGSSAGLAAAMTVAGGESAAWRAVAGTNQ